MTRSSKSTTSIKVIAGSSCDGIDRVHRTWQDGGAIAAKLLKAGFKLQVYNRTAEKAAGLVARGARFVCQPGDAAEPGRIAIIMLANDRALEDVGGGDRGVSGTTWLWRHSPFDEYRLPTFGAPLIQLDKALLDDERMSYATTRLIRIFRSPQVSKAPPGHPES